MKKYRTVYPLLVIALWSCAHTEKEQTTERGAGTRGELQNTKDSSASANGTMTISQPSAIKHEKIPCNEGKDKAGAGASNLRPQVEIGIAKDIPTNGKQPVGAYTRYQECE